MQIRYFRLDLISVFLAMKAFYYFLNARKNSLK